MKPTKHMNRIVTHCEWCGKRIEDISYRKTPFAVDTRMLVFTDKGPLKVCRNCYQYMNINDTLPSK